MRIIAVNTGVKFGEWYVKNLKHMIDKYSGLEYESFEVIRDEKYEAWFKTTDICTLWQEYYYNLFCFAHTLKSLGHNFLLFNAAVNVMGEEELDSSFRGYLFHTPYYTWCNSQPNILPGQTFSIPEWCKENNVKTTDTGHIADDEGCLVFSKWLHNRLLQGKLL